MPNLCYRSASIINIGPDVSGDGIDILIANGLENKVPDMCRAWREGKAAAQRKRDQDQDESGKEISERLAQGEQDLHAIILPIVAKKSVQRLP
jgi:hypothetical protein